MKVKAGSGAWAYRMKDTLVRPMRRKSARNGFAGGDRIIHHVQWQYPQLIPFNVLIGHRPFPRRYLSPAVLDKYGSGIVIKRSDRRVWYGTSGDLGSGNPAFTLSRGSCKACGYNALAAPCFTSMLLSPLSFDAR